MKEYMKIRKLSLIFLASFLKESETFSWQLLQFFLNFQSRVGWLFSENNQKWPKTKRRFDTFNLKPHGKKKKLENFDQ